MRPPLVHADRRFNRRLGEEVVIVGGSLSGLTLAMACAKRGIPTLLLERVAGCRRSGAALSIDRSLLLEVTCATSVEAESFPSLTADRNGASWQAVYEWLRKLALRRSEIRLQDGTAVIEVHQNDATASVVTSTGVEITAKLIVGADGYQSVVRRAVLPEKPYALYAGYLVWRGLVPEAELTRSSHWFRNDDGAALVTESGFRLVAYPVAGPSGSLHRGKRLVSFSWYDKTRTRLLLEQGCVSVSGEVRSSLAPDQIPQWTLDELSEVAARIWPDPWRATILHALKRRSVFATPIAEYSAERLHRGRLVLIGDAAHVFSPATGMGFVCGILEAEALARFLEEAGDLSSADVADGLRMYAEQRLPPAQALASLSSRWNRAYVSTADGSPPKIFLPPKRTETKS